MHGKQRNSVSTCLQSISCNFFDLPVVKSSWELKRLVALVAREFGALAGGRG